MPVRRLTDVTLTKLRAPEKTGASIDYFDAGQAALALRVGRQSRSWTVFARLNGRLRRVTLGHYPTMGLAEARQKATELVAAFREGHDPTLERKQNTVEAVVADWLADDQAKNRTVLGVTRLMAKDVLPTLGPRPIASVTRRDLKALVRVVAARGAPIQARRLHAYLRRLFTWAVAEEIVTENPALGISPPGEEIVRDRTLSNAELRDVWRAAGEPALGPFGPIVKLLILTGARQSEIAEARWSEVDLDRAEIRISGSRMKGKKAHVIPLSPPAVAIFAGLPRVAEHVFVGRTRGKPVTGWGWAKKRLDALSGVTGWRIHDLRRTTAANLQRLGVKLEVTEAVLAHRSGARSGLVKVYQTYEYDLETRRALEAWAVALDRIIADTAPAPNVLPLRHPAAP